MNEQETVRLSVAEAYSKAVTSEAGCCCGSPVQKGVAAKLAGYTQDELDALPPEAVVNSFGCGNPLAFGEIAPGDVVLDLGSGAGIDVLLAAKKVGPTGRAIGVDMTDDMIAKANENIAAAGLDNVEIRKGIIEELPVESDSVDWVISNCVINLSPDKPKVFAEIARVLKPGGRMLVSDIVIEHLPDWLRGDERLYSSCIAGAISEAAYIDGLTQAGLSDVEVRERLVYDHDQLADFIQSELPESGDAGACGGGVTSDPAAARKAAETVVGQVWSAKFFARKPGD
ncbi:MAG: arsenite methyltransferase [bacterium]|nr:arsenite methyltransferase [bacterium]